MSGKSIGNDPSGKSYGYSVHGEKQKESIIRQCQRLADDEHSTNDGFILTLALAGGTGSGLGTRICEEIRSEFGKSHPILVHAVWPYETGEVVIQNYNILLAFSKLYNCADGLIFHSNSIVHDICNVRYNIKQVRFPDINSYIANELTRHISKYNSQILHHISILKFNKCATTSI